MNRYHDIKNEEIFRSNLNNNKRFLDLSSSGTSKKEYFLLVNYRTLAIETAFFLWIMSRFL